MKDVMRTTCKLNTLRASAALLMAFSATLNAAPDAVKRGVVLYEDFGAKGDGKTDDHASIALAHKFANERRLPVKANDAATYFIGGGDTVVVIQTDAQFGKAKFIIDDTHVAERGNHVFEVNSTLQPIRPKNVTSLKLDQQKINIDLPQACMVVATDANVKRFIRRGANQSAGAPQNDIFVVDKEGNVDPNTPIVWDFDTITDIIAYPIDEKPLKITGGHFTTIANKAKPEYKYYGRGIAIRRSNIIIDGIEHHVTGEGNQGAPYGGFLNIQQCANVTVSNAVFTARKTYRTKLGNFKKKMGTYDLYLERAMNVSFINCRQSNDIHDESNWGIMASSFCKNLIYDGCTFSRFDAHQGVSNATIRNSTIGHAGIEVIGTGTLLLENTTVRSGSFVNLREDYGSTWRGDLIIRNCIFQPKGDKSSPVILTGKNNGQHSHGYTAHMPERITIEKLHIEDTNPPADYNGPAVLGNFNPGYKDTSFIEKFPYKKTREVIIKDVNTASGKPIRLSDNPVMFRDVVAKGITTK